MEGVTFLINFCTLFDTLVELIECWFSTYSAVAPDCRDNNTQPESESESFADDDALWQSLVAIKNHRDVGSPR